MKHIDLRKLKVKGAITVTVYLMHREIEMMKKLDHPNVIKVSCSHNATNRDTWVFFCVWWTLSVPSVCSYHCNTTQATTIKCLAFGGFGCNVGWIGVCEDAALVSARAANREP